MMMRAIAGLMVASLALAPAMAADEAKPANAGNETKPAISIKTKTVEITVTINNELKPFPALVANSLAEGKRFVAESRAEAAGAGKDDRRYTYDRVYEFRSVVGGRYVGVVRSDSTYTGGAHPNQLIDTILWDNDAKKRISVRPFFSETADNGPTMTALAKFVRLVVAAAKRDRFKEAEAEENKGKPPEPAAPAEPDELLIGRVLPALTKIGPLSFAPSTIADKSSGLTVHYSPYDVDAYAAGPYSVFVPWTEFRQYLSPLGVSIFGGERPKADADEN